MITAIQEGKKTLGIQELTEVAGDAGYYNDRDVVAVKPEDGIDLYVAHPRDVKGTERRQETKSDKVPAAGYGGDDFRHDPERDVFICPAGKELAR